MPSSCLEVSLELGHHSRLFQKMDSVSIEILISPPQFLHEARKARCWLLGVVHAESVDTFKAAS